MLWSRGAREVRRPTTMPTTYLQNIFPMQFGLAGEVMIKLNASTIRLVLGLQRNIHPRLLFVSVVQE